MRNLILLTTLLAGVALAADPPTNYTPDKLAAKAYAAAQAAGATQTTNPKSADAAAVAAGSKIYNTTCVTCHGKDGKGDGPAAIALDPHPADFTDSARWKFTSVGVHHWIVEHGIHGSGMAPLGLTDDQAWDVLAYIQSNFESTTPTTVAGASPAGPVTSAP